MRINVYLQPKQFMRTCWEVRLTMWTAAVSIGASRYCDTLNRQQRSRIYFLCSRDDDVML